MSKTLVTLIAISMLMSVMSFAMNCDHESTFSNSSDELFFEISRARCYSDSESSSDSEGSDSSESPRVYEKLSTEFVVYIKNPEAAGFVRYIEKAQGVDAWQRGVLKQEKDIAEAQKFIQWHSYGIKLCELLDNLKSNFLAERTVIPMPQTESGLFIKFKTILPVAVRDITKCLQKSPYITDIVTDNVYEYIAHVRNDQPWNYERKDECVTSGYEPCVDDVYCNRMSNDFIVYIGCPTAAQMLIVVMTAYQGDVFQWRKNEFEKGKSLRSIDIWDTGNYHFIQLCRVIEKVKKRFGAECNVMQVPEQEKGLYLRFYFEKKTICQRDCFSFEKGKIYH